MTNKTFVESDQYCFRCGQPLEIGNECDLLCSVCESRITGLSLSEPPFQRDSAKIIWRLKRLVNQPYPGSDDLALMARLDEIARMAMAAKECVKEGI